MQSVNQQIIVLLHQPVIISCAIHLLRPSSAIGDFPAVYRIFQNPADQRRIKQGIFPVLPLDFVNPVGRKVFCKTVCTGIRMHILVKNHADCRCFFLIDEKLSLFQLVAIWRKAAIPFTLTGFLDSALHGLHTDIFTLNFSHSRENGDHQLPGVLGGINPVLHANQIDTEILHHLQGGQHIRRISAEAGQLEHQHIGHAVFTGLDILHHAVKLHAPFNGLAGFTCILVFAHNLIVIELGIGFHSGFLCIQRVSVNLHGSGHARIDIDFYLFFFHHIFSASAYFLSVFCSNSLMESR